MTGDFYRVACPECDEEQIVFGKAATEVRCAGCDHVLARPTGGLADIDGEITETVEAR